MKYKDKYLQEKDAKEYAQQSFENIRKQNVELLEQIERLQKQLEIATKALKEYSWGNNWLDAGCRGQVFLPTKRGYSIADKALEEMEGVK